MTHVANQRIKKGGEYFAAGEPITLTKEELADLPNGAVTANDGDADAPEFVVLDDAQQAQLKDAVEKLKPGAFKQDGEIRAGALKHLNEALGFTVSVENVAAALTAGGE